MPKILYSLTLCSLVIGCHDVGDDLVRGPYTLTDKTVYGIGDPITVTIWNDGGSPINISVCCAGPPFYLDRFENNSWREYLDFVSPCSILMCPSYALGIEPQDVHSETIPFLSFGTPEPGIYRIRIPYAATMFGSTTGEATSNTFTIR